jgi:hypothetical protein
MKIRLLMWILWPSFLVAGMAEGFIFTVFSPEDLTFFGQPIEASFQATYTISFFILWMFCAFSSALSISLLPGTLSELEEKSYKSLI